MTGCPRWRRPGLWLLALVVVMPWIPALAGTLGDVRARGRVDCGVADGVPGFSAADADGNWAGIGADYCRAIAAAILGDAEKVRFVPLPAASGAAALRAGEIDVLAGIATWTLRNETEPGIAFAGVIYHDGQALMVRRSLDAQSALELSGTTICIVGGTASETAIADFFRSHGMPYKLMTFETPEEALRAYEGGGCDVYAASALILASELLKLAGPAAHVILPEQISNEPLAPAVRQDDTQWLGIARWVLFALIDAEELGVSKDNAAALAAGGAPPPVKRLLGTEGDFGKPLGLDSDWALRAIQAVGNYGELFERNLGPRSGLNIDRGLNHLWNKGGILFAAPVR